MKMPLNCVPSPPHEGSHGSWSTPYSSTSFFIAADAIAFARAINVASPVDAERSTSPPMSTPWLYVHVAPPLFLQLARPSLTSDSPLIIPDASNHFHSRSAQSRKLPLPASPGVRRCKRAATSKNSSFAIAFLYVRSLLHQI